jgi:hypothetical protein
MSRVLVIIGEQAAGKTRYINAIYHDNMLNIGSTIMAIKGIKHDIHNTKSLKKLMDDGSPSEINDFFIVESNTLTRDEILESKLHLSDSFIDCVMITKDQLNKSFFDLSWFDLPF